MNTSAWVASLVLTMMICEGFVFSVYAEQIPRWLQSLEPRWLQIAGLVETALAVVLWALIVRG